MGQAKKKSRPFSASATSSPRDVSGSVRSVDLRRMAVARRQLPMRQQAQPQPVQGVRRAALPQEAPGHRQAALGAGRPDAAQGRQRHAGGFRVRERLVSQGSHRPVVPSAFTGTCAPAGTAGRNRFVPGWPARASGGTPYPAPEWPEKSDQPRRPRPVSTASLETPARVASGCPGATPATGTSAVDSLPVVPSSQAMARACALAPKLLRRQQRHQRGHPGALVDASLRRPASVRPPGCENPPQAALGRLRLSRREQRQDGVDRGFGPRRAADVWPAAIPILFACKNPDRHRGYRADGRTCFA